MVDDHVVPKMKYGTIRSYGPECAGSAITRGNSFVTAVPEQPDCSTFWGMADGTFGPRPDPEDEFDRQLRALTEGLADEPRFRELSAAERAKAGAKRARQARKQAARSAAEAKRAAGRAARREGQPGGGSGRAGGHGRLRAVTVLVACLAVVVGLTWLRFDHSTAGGTNDTLTVRNGAVPSAGPSATAPRSAAPSAVVLSGPPTDPFAGTPAQDWADDAAGIVPPPAAPVGGFTAARVAAAYQTTKKLLIAAFLDRRTLLGGAPAAFADLLSRQQRTQFVADLDKIGLDSHGGSLSTRGWVVSFAPHTALLVGPVIKVYGVMSAHPGTDHGRAVLDVDVNYRFVYPVEPPGTPADWMRIVGQVHGPVEFGDWAQASTPFEPWVLFSVAEAGGRCDVHDGYVHPDYPNSAAQTVRPSGRPVDPYSMATPRWTDCQAVTRT